MGGEGRKGREKTVDAEVAREINESLARTDCERTRRKRGERGKG